MHYTSPPHSSNGTPALVSPYPPSYITLEQQPPGILRSLAQRIEQANTRIVPLLLQVSATVLPTHVFDLEPCATQ